MKYTAQPSPAPIASQPRPRSLLPTFDQYIPPTTSTSPDRNTPTDTCSRKWPLSELRLCTLNVSSGLARLANDVNDYMDHHSLDVLFCPDCGSVDARVFDALPNKKVVHSPAGPDGWSCAIIIRGDLPLSPTILNDPSGRAVAVDMYTSRDTEKVIRLITLYQPPNLDNAPDSPATKYTDQPRGTLRGHLLRGEAERLRIVVQQWATADRVTNAIMGGDLNETHFGPRDRVVGAARLPGELHIGTIHKMVEDDGWVDTHSIAHPFSENDPHPDLSHHTYRGRPGQGSSRIDYILLHSPSLMQKHHDYQHSVDTSYEIGTDVGHLPLRCTVPVSRIDPSWDSRFYTDNGIRTHNLEPQVALDLGRAVVSHLSPSTEAWVHSLKEVTYLGCPHAEYTVGKVASEIIHEIKTAAATIVPVRASGIKNIPKCPPARRRLTTIKKWLCKLRAALRYTLDKSGTCVPETAFSTLAHAAVQNLRRLNALETVSLQWIPVWRDVDRWWDYLLASQLVLRRLRREINVLSKSKPTDPTGAFNKQMNTPRGRGLYYNHLRGGSTHNKVLASARDEHDVLHRDPAKYIPLVRHTVMQPFSHHKISPAVPMWRPLFQQELKTGIPFWWDSMYAFNAAHAPSGAWSNLSDHTNSAEVFSVLSEASAGKAPGHDGVSIDVLKLATGALNGGSEDPHNPVLIVLTAIVNACLVAQVCPPILKKGIIVMIPKPGKPSDDASNMRPITLLPELGKLTSRILAKRVTTTLHKFPNILHPAQRAYLLDGSSKQCLSGLMDVCEDFHENNQAGDLILTSYDVRKAFDSVQQFSITASCDRLGIPRTFLGYVLASLTNAESSVRCKHGLTDPFTLQSSVRQGDPLAALLFIFVMDALHAGLSHNPLGNDPGRLYTMQNGSTVSSLGYADDTALTSSTLTGAALQHEWVREFFVAHHLRFNSSKSYCIVASGHNTTTDTSCSQPTYLPGIDESQVHDPVHGNPNGGTHTPEQEDIPCSPPNTCFRYLGLPFRVDLDPHDTVLMLNAKVWSTCTKIRAQRLDLCQASNVFREFLLPQLELGFIYAQIPAQKLQLWTSIIRRSVLHGGCDKATRNVCTDALLATLGMRSLADEVTVARATECANSLRGSHHISATTSQCRLESAQRNRYVLTDRLWTGSDHHLITKSPRRKRTGGRLINALWEASKFGVRMSWSEVNTTPLWRGRWGSACTALNCPILYDYGNNYHCLPSLEPPPLGIVAFTDGSFAPHAGGGYAAILCAPTDLPNLCNSTPKVTLTGPTPLAGANYAAELRAILAALQAVPINVTIKFVTDAQSAIHAILKDLLPEGTRLRLGCRSLVISCRELIQLRTLWDAPTTFKHVRSHTGLVDTDSIGNRLADHAAPKAASWEAPPFLMAEEKYVLWERKPCKKGSPDRLCHIAGNLRKTLKSLANQHVLDSWQQKRTQGSVPRLAGMKVMRWLETIRNLGNNSLLLFLMQMVTKQLPDVHKTDWDSNNIVRCKLCGEHCTPEHPFTCPHNHTARTEMTSLVRWKLKKIINHLADTGIVGHDHLAMCYDFANRSNWLNLTHEPGGWGFPGDNIVNQNLQATLTDIEHTDKWVNLCGILPTGLTDLLQPANRFLQCDDVTAKTARKTVHGNLTALQLTILGESRRVLETWRKLQRHISLTYTRPPPWLPVHAQATYVSTWPSTLKTP
jgi:ribonuclease HI